VPNHKLGKSWLYSQQQPPSQTRRIDPNSLRWRGTIPFIIVFVLGLVHLFPTTTIRAHCNHRRYRHQHHHLPTSRTARASFGIIHNLISGGKDQSGESGSLVCCVTYHRIYSTILAPVQHSSRWRTFTSPSVTFEQLNTVRTNHCTSLFARSASRLSITTIVISGF